MVWGTSHKVWAGTVFAALIASPVYAERVAMGVPEFPEETEALVAATVSLFEAAEELSGPEPSERLTLTPRPTNISAETPEALTAFDTERGPVRHLTGYRITWYPVDSLLGAVDFMGTWDNARNLVCGHVTWDLSDPAAPVMRALVANYVDVSDIAASDRATKEAALLEANCAFGEIDQNYAVLN